MELKKAKLSGTTSESGLGLQHEAAMRVEARYQAEEKLRRHLQRMERLKVFSLFLLFLAVALGGGYYAWRKGLLDEPLAHFGIFRQQDMALASSVGDEPGAEDSAPSVKGDAHVTVQEIAKTIDAYNEAVGKFAGVSIAYWKDALPTDKPKKNGSAMDYTALVPNLEGGFTILKILFPGDNSMKIRRITQTREEDVSRTEFNKMVELTPFLVLREGRCYYCPARKPVRRTGFAVPKKGEGFNPSCLEFGPLYDQVPKSKIAKPTFKFYVFLDHEKIKKALPVATVGFGEEVPRERFEAAARAAVDDDTVVSILLAAGKVGFSSAQ